MRILFVLPSLFPNGPVRVMLSIAPELRKNGNEVKFWYFDDLSGSVKENAQQIKFFDRPDLSEFDIIHSAGIRPDAYVRYHHKHINIPKVTTMMNYVTEDLKYQYNLAVSKVFTPLWRYAIGKHDVVVSQQEAMKSYYFNLWNLKNQEVIPLCSLFEKKEIDEKIAEQIAKFKNGARTLVSVSLVTDRKGLNQVIELLRLPGNEGLKWVHIGSGKDFVKLKESVSKNNLNDRVLLLGQVPNSAAYMPLFDVYVMPSYSEGFGLALLEAVIQKVPAITTDLEVFKTIFSHKEVPKFKPNDITAFNGLIHHTKEEFLSQVDDAYKRYLNDYTIESVAQKYITLYRSLIENRWKPN